MSERNHEITKVQRLLNADGHIAEPGWSRKQFQIYDRADIKAPKFRIKEWDYYIAISSDGNYGVAFTISDDGYIGLQSASLLDFNKGWEHTETILNAFPMGKLRLPPSADKGNVSYHDKRLKMDFIKDGHTRRITCEYKNFFEGKTLTVDLTLEEPDMDSLVIATPWKEKPTAFYYNRKINCMPCTGKAVFDGKEYVFDGSKDFATLDWGRGVWTYDNTWYWGSGNAVINGKPFGFNLGYGFSDRSSATENIVFYDGVGHKLDDVTFNIPEENGVKQYTKPWTFTSSDGRFEAEFVPVLDRAAKIDVKFIITDQHQVFGRLTGKCILDDGTVLEFKDVLCFAEDVHNKY